MDLATAVSIAPRVSQLTTQVQSSVQDVLRALGDSRDPVTDDLPELHRMCAAIEAFLHHELRSHPFSSILLTLIERASLGVGI